MSDWRSSLREDREGIHVLKREVFSPEPTITIDPQTGGGHRDRRRCQAVLSHRFAVKYANHSISTSTWQKKGTDGSGHTRYGLN
jgi:hypothetical protein